MLPQEYWNNWVVRKLISKTPEQPPPGIYPLFSIMQQDHRAAPYSNQIKQNSKPSTLSPLSPAFLPAVTPDVLHPYDQD